MASPKRVREFVRELQSGKAPSDYLLGYEALDTELGKPTYDLVQLYLAGAPPSAMPSDKQALEKALQERRRINSPASPSGTMASAQRFANASGAWADTSLVARGGHDAHRTEPAAAAAATRESGAGTAAVAHDASGGITDQQLQVAVDVIGQMVAGTYCGNRSTPMSASTFTTEPQGAHFLLDAVRAATSAGSFSDATLVAGLGRWADALPALIQRVEADGRVSPPGIAALREGTDRAATALRVMAMAPHQGFLRSLLLSALLKTPRSLAGKGAPIDRDQIEKLGAALMDRLRYTDRSVSEEFRRIGLEAIRDTHGAHLLNTAQRQALDRNFNDRVDGSAREERYDEWLLVSSGSRPSWPQPSESRATISRSAQRSARSTQDGPSSGVRGFFARLLSGTRRAPEQAAFNGSAHRRR